MEFKILDKRTEESKNCFLAKADLYSYINGLPDDYQDYEVQREIVSNIYLDNLIETILYKRHIPPIVLVVESGDYINEEYIFKVKNFKILDGLQRTFRLKTIFDTILLFQKELKANSEILEYTKFKLSRTYSKELISLNSSTSILSRIIEFYKDSNIEKITSLYADNSQWFEIWTDLTPNEEVQKMLVLNAGHKPVKTKHQLELLFRNLLPIIKKVQPDNFELIREKEQSSTAYSKNRKPGQFHFSQLISSIISLKEGRPITTNVGLIQKTQNEDFEIEKYSPYFNYEFFEKYILTLINLDKAIIDAYGDIGIKWIGREVSLVGVFAAIGRFINEKEFSPVLGLDIIQSNIVNKVDKLNLNEFEEVRNNLDLSKINIGTVNKKAVFEAITDLIETKIESVNWKKYFKA